MLTRDGLPKLRNCICSFTRIKPTHGKRFVPTEVIEVCRSSHASDLFARFIMTTLVTRVCGHQQCDLSLQKLMWAKFQRVWDGTLVARENAASIEMNSHLDAIRLA